MCTLCECTQPWTDDCVFSGLVADRQSSAEQGDGEGDGGGGTSTSALPIFTYDQIATQLTSGYWGGTQRAFDAGPGDTLYVDVSALTTAGQDMALQALSAWGMVTGITFQETSADSAPINTYTETVDASAGINTVYSMAIGDDFLGTLSTGADNDGIAISLNNGDIIDITLSGEGPSGTADPYLRVLNAAGAILAQNDDAFGTDSALTYEATYTGTHYIEAASFADQNPGDYRVTVRMAGAVADIVFDDEDAGAYATSAISNGVIQSSFVNIDANWSGGQNRTDGYFYQTYLHEIGHALGLGHAGNYNGGATYGTSNHYQNDSWQASVMSYFHQTENTSIEADFAYVITPQVADIIAIQSLYGTPEANTGNTTYGDGGNTGTFLDTALSLSNPVSFTVFDTDGTDTFDFSSYSSHQKLDLRAESFSDLAGQDGNIGIAQGTIIEHGRTGWGNDTLIGNDAGNGLSADFGHDTIEAGAGNDAIRGGAGNDTLDGDSGADLIEGGTGDNIINGGTGGDLLIGDDVTLAMLTALYPTWTPPADAQTLLDTDQYWALWDDIIDDQGIA